MTHRRVAWLLACLGLVACGQDRAPRTSVSTSISATSATPAASPPPPATTASTPVTVAAEVPATVPPMDATTIESSTEWWQPPLGITWQWQLSGELDLTDPAELFEIDWETTSAAHVTALHAQGKRAMCYFSAGSWEPYRSDAATFPSDVLGSPLDGWADERWLDIRRHDVLLPIMGERLDVCKQKGFDAVEADNVDGYENDSGFPLTFEDQLTYNRALAAMAHERGMAIALKNNLAQVDELVDDFDLAVNEECVAYDECDALRVFTEQGKPVLHAEYAIEITSFCPMSRSLGFSSIAKNQELDAAVQRC